MCWSVSACVNSCAKNNGVLPFMSANSCPAPSADAGTQVSAAPDDAGAPPDGGATL
jgi:hypothetical protein